MSGPQHESENESSSASSTLVRSFKIVILIVTLLLGGIAATAFIMGGESDLPFEYEGFD